eukprot:6209439-Pleurochrysis_carterae.AAC.1
MRHSHTSFSALHLSRAVPSAELRPVRSDLAHPALQRAGEQPRARARGHALRPASHLRRV